MDRPINHHNQHHHLGINKIGKLIKKEPDTTSHRPSPPPPPPPRTNGSIAPHPQHIYNISKNDFRSFVQQLTGSDTSRGACPPQQRPRPSQRLHQIRPPPLAPVLPPAPAPPPVAKFPAESPVTSYMRYLENSLLYSDGSFATPVAGAPAPAPTPAMSVRSPAWLSPYPLLSPGFQSLSPLPPMSPAMIFPPSPAGFLLSPRWRNDK